MTKRQNPPTIASGDPPRRHDSGLRRNSSGECLECGEPFLARRTTALFCGNRCRKVFNNRKAMRGAIAYDFLLAWRFDRTMFEAVGGRTLLSRLIAGFRAEDRRDRAGRRSWDKIKTAKERAARFLSIVVTTNAVGSDRRGRTK
jgi:hypothetical protein